MALDINLKLKMLSKKDNCNLYDCLVKFFEMCLYKAAVILLIPIKRLASFMVCPLLYIQPKLVNDRQEVVQIMDMAP